MIVGSMPRTPSLSTDTIETLLTAYAETGSQAAAARKAGVPLSTAQRYLAKTPKAAASVVAQQRVVIERVGASMWDTRAALDDNFTRLLRLVEQLENAPRMEPLVYVVVLREIREHVATGMKLARLMLDVNEVKLFQEAVIEAIGEADADTRARLVHKLQERRAVGLALGSPDSPHGRGPGKL